MIGLPNVGMVASMIACENWLHAYGASAKCPKRCLFWENLRGVGFAPSSYLLKSHTKAIVKRNEVSEES